MPSYVAGASVALLLVLAFREVHFTAIALILPLLLICYLTLRSSFGRLEDAQGARRRSSTACCSRPSRRWRRRSTRRTKSRTITSAACSRARSALARELGVTDADDAAGASRPAALLHDTGKIAVPEHILNKPGQADAGRVREDEAARADRRARSSPRSSFPIRSCPIVRHHHENWDGTGYPDGLKGDDIPLGARILSVVDCFDALTSDRPYRRRMTDAARAEDHRRSPRHDVRPGRGRCVLACLHSGSCRRPRACRIPRPRPLATRVSHGSRRAARRAGRRALRTAASPTACSPSPACRARVSGDAQASPTSARCCG